jgi:SAM-dependent methyltransferase
MTPLGSPDPSFSPEKAAVQEFWNRASCGEVYAQGDSLRAQLEAQARSRYELEPYIPEFARFEEGTGRDVLEIGVGMGADHLEWARSKPRSLSGVDLTPRAVEHTSRRLGLYGLTSRLEVSDAENLPFPTGAFDLVYSWGVLHHSPDTRKAIGEVCRVLRPGGRARVMIYHKYAMVGYMLWLRYGLLAGRPGRSLSDIYAEHLESPGTKAYTREEAREMFGGFSRVDVAVRLCFGDLLQGEVGQRHQNLLLRAAKAIWPRWLIRHLLPQHGLALTIEATK